MAAMPRRDRFISIENLTGSSKDDILNGDAGDDRLIGGPGADTFNGGDGNDVIDFRTSTNAVTVTLSSSAGSYGSGFGDAAGDKFGYDIEGVAGGSGDDRLTGNVLANRLEGNAGNELLEHEKELQQIEGRISDLSSTIPQTESAIVEMGRRQTEARLQFRTDAEKERADTELADRQARESVSAMADRATRSEVEAPIAGTVNKLFTTTVGGTVKSGEPLAQIVPSDASIEVEARLSPADRAEVWPGLPGGRQDQRL